MSWFCMRNDHVVKCGNTLGDGREGNEKRGKMLIRFFLQIGIIDQIEN